MATIFEKHMGSKLINFDHQGFSYYYLLYTLHPEPYTLHPEPSMLPTKL